jgi:CBS domain-containing protein
MVLRDLDRVAQGQLNVLTVEATECVADAAKTMSRHHVGSVIVTGDHGKTVGILTERDILSRVVAAGADPNLLHVSDVMTRKVVACTLDTTITRAEQIMAGHRIRHLPIIEDGRLVGMISSRDILAHELSQIREIVRQQSRMLTDLESQHPGITAIERDSAGRVVI